MKYSNEYIKEDTLLTPTSTQIRIEGWLTEEQHLYQPNRFGEYIVKFQPYTPWDAQVFTDMGEECQRQVDMMKSPYSSKVASNSYIDDKGVAYASQLFTPHLEISEEEYIHKYKGRLSDEVFEIKGFFKDGPDGQVFFQIVYLDLMPSSYP